MNSPDHKRSEKGKQFGGVLLVGLSVLFLFAVTDVAQSKRMTAPSPPATKEISWPKWNFIFTAPSSWRLYMENAMENDKVPYGFHEETRYFTRTPDRPNVYPHSDLTITFTTWPGPDFIRKTPSGRTLAIPLDEFMTLEQGTPETWRPQLEINPQFEAVRYETLDGVKGVLLQRSVLLVSRHRPTDKLAVGWTGYRVFNGKLQRITASFECTRAEVPRVETILHSFKFAG